MPFSFFSDKNYQSNMAYSIRHRDFACLPKTPAYCFRIVDRRHHYLPHLNWIFTSHKFVVFIKQYTFQILTLHTTSSFILQMIRRWQPCCSVIKPCSYESTQNSALFHLKLIKSTQHLYEAFFLPDSTSHITIGGPLAAKLHHFWRFFPSQPLTLR